MLAKLKNEFLRYLSKVINQKSHRVKIFDSYRMIDVGKRLYIFSNHKIIRGPFKDVTIPPCISDETNSYRASWILGLFEQQLHAFLESRHWNLVVNLGGAEGYYPICMLKKNLCETAIVFESLESGREAIRRFSKENGVENRIEIHGHADRNFLSHLPHQLPEGANRLIVDIEGGEFDLFHPEVIDALSAFHILLEVHDFATETKEEVEELLDLLSNNYMIQILDENTRTFPNRNQVPCLSREDVFLVGAEGRSYDMFWVLASPK